MLARDIDDHKRREQRLEIQSDMAFGRRFASPMTGPVHTVGHHFLYPDGGTATNVYLPDGSLFKVTGSAVFPVRYDYGVESDGGINRLYTKETKLDASGNPTSEWVKHYQDGLGRTYKTVYAAASGTPTHQRFFNNKGQLEKEVDPDGVTTLYRYNAKGEQYITAVDVNRDGFVSDIDPGDTLRKDRVTRTTVQVMANGATGNNRGMDIVRTVKEVWTTDGSANTAKVSTTDSSTDGLHTWQVAYRDQSTEATTITDIQIPTAGNSWNRTVTQTAPDNTKTVSVSQYGRVTSVTLKNSSNDTVTSTTYAYDKHGRQDTATDLRGAVTSFNYNEADLVRTNTSPNPGTGRQETVTYYDALGRNIGTRLPDQATTTNLYWPNGLLKQTYGARTYAAGYGYDVQGRMKTMTNWSSFNTVNGTGTGARVTTWNYNSYRGWLDNKRYPNPSDGSPSTTGPSYTYSVGGRLKTRTWARNGNNGQPIVTTYTYGFDDTPTDNDHADLVKTEYSANDPAATPAVSSTYDRRGRRQQVTQTGGTATTFGYNDANLMTSETYTGGTLDGASVSWVFDNKLRRDTLSVGGVTPAYSLTYGYDTAGRLQTVSHGGSVVTYGYVANSMLVGTVTHTQGGVTVTTTKAPDVLNRLQSISTVSGGTTVSYSYLYNNANLRERATLADSSYWVYTYDALGQVQTGKKYWSDGTFVAGQQFEYSFDAIGNRSGPNGAKTGGDPNGANLRSQEYNPDFLNRYTSRTVPRYVQSMGTANASAPVWLWSINGLNTLTSRKGTYFWGELFLNNNNALYAPLTNIALLNNGQYLGREVRTNWLPATPEVFGYDLDGNLTSDGRWNYTWDAENRLIRLVANNAVAPQQRIDFQYDWQGRRISKKVWNNTAGSGNPVVHSKFVYDGWNLCAEMDALNPQPRTLIRSYVWGTDLSGSLHGAGGVGGLVKLTYHGTQTTNAFVAYDGNGNVTALFDASNNALLASYEYGPFGELVRASGPMAKANPVRYSTKYQDDETEMVYYGYRYYNPGTGRWLSRDPLGEHEDSNLFGFVGNGPLFYVDDLGLGWWPKGEPKPVPFPPGGPVIPKLPPNSPTMPATPATTPSQGFAGAPGLCADMWNQILNRREYREATKICRDQIRSRGLGEKCCVMLFCSRCGCFSERISVTRVMTYLADSPCEKAKAEFETPGAVLKPSCPKDEQQVPAYKTMFRLSGGYGD